MRAKVLQERPSRTLAAIFDTGDEVMAGLERLADEHRLGAAAFTAIGAFSDVVLGYFDWEKREYLPIPVNDQVEVLSLIGDVALEGTRPKVHAHVVVGTRDGTARGGHLLRAHVRPTLEVILTESPGHLERRHDAASGLALIRIDPEAAVTPPGSA
jgi:predicted DNA-binding protein with PD1-like motif